MVVPVPAAGLASPSMPGGIVDATATSRMRWIRWFVAGALAVPLFHQGLLLILNETGLVARRPFALTPTEPFGVPQVVSLSFWGGVWGIVLGLVLARVIARRTYWVVALIFGAVAPTAVALLVVGPLKGQPIAADPKMILTGLAVNAAWGIGTAALYAAMSGRSGRAA